MVTTKSGENKGEQTGIGNIRQAKGTTALEYYRTLS